MPSPGDIVYDIGSIQLLPKSTQCQVEVLIGVLDKNGNTAYHSVMVAVALGASAVDAFRTAVTALAAADPMLTGAVPAV